jgi:hypothetical protein
MPCRERAVADGLGGIRATSNLAFSFPHDRLSGDWLGVPGRGVASGPGPMG